MFVVRAVKKGDLDGLYNLSLKSESGLTTLPKHKPSLKERITKSLAAFKSKKPLEGKHDYLFVMEELETGKIVGTSAIIAGIGLDQPFYCYRLLHQTQVSNEPKMRIDTELLQLSNDFIGATEIATLFLDPDYRKGNLGKLLAKARYLFIAAHSERFSDKVMSEIRGWVNENEDSPFWEALGRHFFGMSFKEADAINGQGNNQFIGDMMPKFPIYTSLLPESARAVLGKPHDNAMAAIKLLEKEGFRFSGAVDIFDAGPEMEVHKRGILTVRLTTRGKIAGTVEGGQQQEKTLVANPSLDKFCVVLSNVVETDSGSWIPERHAEILGLKVEDDICYAPLKRSGERRGDV